MLACENSRFSSLLAARYSFARTCATQRQKFHTDDAKQCLYKKPVVMEFRMQIRSILRFSWSILVSVVFIYERAPTKRKCFSKRRIYSTNIDCFVIDSSRLHLTFVASHGLLSVIHKQQLKQYNYSVVQSVLMTGFRTDFTPSVWN